MTKLYPLNNENFLKQDQKAVNKSTRIVIIILWFGTLLLLGFMISKWQGNAGANVSSKGRNASFIFVDNFLLSSTDLKFGDSTSLINISLNPGSSPANAKVVPQQKQDVFRNVLYDNVLQQKIKKAKADDSKGFTIKPVPE